MPTNHWQTFHEALPEDGTIIRVKDDPDNPRPMYMVRHGRTLKYRIRTTDPWQGVGSFTEYVFSHCVWCYDSQYSPESPEDNRPVYPQEHFLKWVTAYRPQIYNDLLSEYNDFCKDNPEKAAAL